jgi:hypothetical protein
MELSLNLGWVALAALMCWLWVRHARREGVGRWVQAISLALVLATMFTVITMYDDMAMAQNPAETRRFQREEDSCGHAHAPFHPAVALAPGLAEEPLINMFRSAGVSTLFIPPLALPFLSSIQNRPPPAA